MEEVVIIICYGRYIQYGAKHLAFAALLKLAVLTPKLVSGY